MKGNILYRPYLNCASASRKTHQPPPHSFLRFCMPTYGMMPAQPPKLESTPVKSGRRLRSSNKTANEDSTTTTNSNGRSDASKHNTSKNSWMLSGTGKLLKTVTPSDLTASTTEVSSASGFELLCTYNWTSLPSPTIYVPGKIIMTSTSAHRISGSDCSLRRRPPKMEDVGTSRDYQER